MDKANVYIRKYFSKQTITGISSHIAAKKLILRCPKLRLNFSVKRMFELLAYDEFLVYPHIQEPALRCTSIVITEMNMIKHAEIF